MNISRISTPARASRAMFTVATLALFGIAQKLCAQDINLLVSKGGQVRLRTAYQLTHTLIVPSSTRITCDTGGSLSEAPMAKMDSVILIQGHGISIEGCDVYSNSAPVLIVLGAHSSRISLVRNHLHGFDHAHGVLIDAQDISGVTIKNNAFDAVGYGILQNARAADLTDVSIDGNTFSNVWGDAIELNDPVTSNCCGAQLTDVRASGVTIKHNKFSVPKHAGSHAGAGFCVGVAGAFNIEISDNDCVAWNEGVHVEDRAHDIKILRNSITTDDHGDNLEQSAIWIIDGQHMTIAQNKIENAAGDGIHLTDDPTHQPSDIEIAGNQVTGCGRYGLFIAGGSLGPMNSNIHHNAVSGCAVSVFLTGKLKSVSFHSNRLEAKNGCVFHISKETNKVDLDMKDNKDPNSGVDASASCAE